MQSVERVLLGNVGKEVIRVEKKEKKDCGCGCGCVPPGKTAKAEKKPKPAKKQAK